MEKYRMGGVFLTLIIALSMILTPCAVFADTAEVPLMLTVEAAPLDFTVTNNIQMSVIQGNSDLTITPVTVTNNGSEKLKVSQIEITAESGWSLASSETDFSTSDSKGKLAFTLNSHDFSSGAYTSNEKITAGSNTTLQLAGKISEQADLTNATKVASMVLTVERDITIISFTIEKTSYQAEGGMTWAEWVESSYNTGGFKAGSNSIYEPKVNSLTGTSKSVCYPQNGYGVELTDIIVSSGSYILLL